MNFYSISVQLMYQREYWFAFADSEDEARGMLAGKIGEKAVEMLGDRLVVERLEVRKGLVEDLMTK